MCPVLSSPSTPSILRGSIAGKIAAASVALVSFQFSSHGSLVGQWVADNYTSGNWADSAGVNDAGTVSGVPVLTPNSFNGHAALTLDGNDFFTVTNNAGLVLGANAMTLVAVFRPTAANASSGGQFWQQAGLIGNEQGGAVSDWGLGFGASQASMGIGGPDTTVASSTLTLNNAYVVIGTWDSAGTLTLYVNGTQVAQNLAAPTAARNANAFPAFALGANLSVVNGDFKGFVGDIAELRIYNDNAQNIPTLNADLTNTYLVPEPSSVALVALGGLMLVRRRRRS